jgi:hypothetical protein
VQGVLAAAIVVAGLYGLSRMGLVEWPKQYDPFALPDLTEKPYWLFPTQLKLIDLDAQNCSFALSHAGLHFTPSLLKGVGTRCELQSGVQLSHLAIAKMRPEDTRCNIAARLFVWEKNVVQPAALHQFGEPVSEILHFGSYNCRTIRGSSYMSEHSTGNAFDIAGFRLKSGKIITVRKDWTGSQQHSQFLHVVHDGLCDYFNLTLSPDYNADHKDHFHVDMGFVRGCH